MAYHNRHASSIAALLIIGGFTAALMAQAPRPTFEVASVRKQPAFIPPSRTPPSSVVFHRLNATVASLVQFGYGIRDFQVIGGPEWARKDLFEINAKAASEASTEQLEPTRGPVDVVLIDSVQQPTEN